MPPNVPQWLDTAVCDPSDITHVLSVLADRERTRARARSSTHSGPLKLKHRLPHVPILAVPKSGLADYYSVSLAYRPENQWFNRYMDIEPYDRTCVKPNNRYW
jgi:hypothetical protein